MDRGDLRRLGPEDLTSATPTPGVAARVALDTEGLWSAVVRIEPGNSSGWHHHGDHDSVAYVLAGRVRFEFGPGGDRITEAGPGDFLLMGPNTVHRETALGEAPFDVVVVRSGRGPTTVTVEGPESAAG
jgi:uncharacterized RmlC-like cupin family protein